MKPVEVYVAGTGNAFMSDIAQWLAEAAALAGRDVTIVTDRLPRDPLVSNLVLAPHEFFLLNDTTDADVNEAAAISVPIGTEQPGTPWFSLGLGLCRPSRRVLDINAHGVQAVRRVGIAATRLALGAVPSMVADAVDRDIDVLFLGGDTPRRGAVLSTLGPVLWNRRSDLRLFRFTEPVHGGVPGLVFGQGKYDLLARTRILVNVHRDDNAPGYFEWARMVETMANGATVVTEPSTGYEPLVPGTHFVSTDDVAGTVVELLAEPDRCRAIGEAARKAVLDDNPLSALLRPVLDELDELDLTQPTWSQRRRTRTNKIVRTRGQPFMPEFRPAETLRVRVYHALLAEQDIQRSIDAARCQLKYGVPSHDVEFTTTGYDASLASSVTPEVSVVVTLYNYAGIVTETLESLAASTDVDIEIIVVDDHSTDDGRAVVQTFMERFADLPVLLLGRENNCGLPNARNHGIERARADKVMIIDADNTVYPVCLRRFADTLDANPEASFVYSTLEAFGFDPGLRSQLPWYVPWLCAANYLDAQAMIRRDVLERHGGYRIDDEWIYGWEDWDLWLRLAVAGEHGVHIPEMLGRYRTQRTSMISMSNLAAGAMTAHLRARYPTLPWPSPARPHNRWEQT